MIVHENRNQFRFYERSLEADASTCFNLKDLSIFLEENMSEEVEIIRNARAWIITNMAAFVNLSIH